MYEKYLIYINIPFLEKSNGISHSPTFNNHVLIPLWNHADPCGLRDLRFIKWGSFYD